MKITFSIKKSAKRNDDTTMATIYVRIFHGKKLDLVAKTNMSVNPNLWDEKNEKIKVKVVCPEDIRKKIDGEVDALRKFIKELYEEEKEEIDKGWLKLTLDKFYNPKKYAPKKPKKPSFHDMFADFLLRHPISEVRKKNFRVIGRVMKRYELYVRLTKKGKKTYKLDIDTLDERDLKEIWNYFEIEYSLHDEYPQLFEDVPEKREQKPRSKNTIIDVFCKLKTFCNWCNANGYTDNHPFENFHIETCLYGTPIYITIEERNRIIDLDLSERPKLAIQRDIFVFQSLIGCRIGDLYRLTPASVVNGAVEYIQGKVKKENPRTVRVPLNDRAKEIIERYSDYAGPELLPFISEQKYNDAIKEIFKLAGVDRIVTVLDQQTRKEVKRPIYEIASSHMARRTFIGNIYKKVKDPNLVAALSGHKEGSKAFARYRDIDEEMKRDLVGLLD